MTKTRARNSSLVALALVTIAGGIQIQNAEAIGRGGGGRGGGGFRGGGGGGFGGARTSVSRPSGGGFSRPSGGSYSRPSGAGTANRSFDRSTTSRNIDRSSVNRNVDRNVNRNVNRDVDIDGDYGYYRGGRYYGYGGYPVARAAAVGVAAGVTAAAIGSMAYSLPSGCATYYYPYGSPYYNCGGVYYAPQYSGSQITYVVVDKPG